MKPTTPTTMSNGSLPGDAPVPKSALTCGNPQLGQFGVAWMLVHDDDALVNLLPNLAGDLES